MSCKFEVREATDLRSHADSKLNRLWNSRSGEIPRRTDTGFIPAPFNLPSLAKALREVSYASVAICPSPSNRAVCEIALSPDERAKLKILAKSLPDPYEQLHRFEEVAAWVGRQLPERLLEVAVDLGKPGRPSALLVSNLPTPDSLPPTPTRALELGTDPSHFSELWMAALCSLVGTSFAYRQERAGRMFQDVFPTEYHRNLLSSQSSESQLGLHTEMVFHPYAPDYLVLYCLRDGGKEAPATRVSGVDQAICRVAARTVALLRQGAFELDVSHIHSPYLADGVPLAEFEGRLPLLPILSGLREATSIRYEPEILKGTRSDHIDALEQLTVALEGVAESVFLAPGSALLMNNARCVHGRSAFRANFSGNDRWLRRVHIAKDIRRTAIDWRSERTIDSDLAIRWRSITVAKGS